MIPAALKYLKRQKATLGAIRTNAWGAKINGHYLILESDDWGAIRTPSRESLEKFRKRGMTLDNSVYKNDALASETDLDALFDLLSGIRDDNGRPLRITANAIMANPNFDEIKASSYREYHYEHFTETFKRYPQHANNWRKWQQAIQEGIFQPQFHGREHLQVRRWLNALQNNRDHTRFCFEHQTTFSGKEDYSFMEAYDWDSPKEVETHREIVKDGLRIFRETFGFQSRSFIAPCYNWDSTLEPALYEQGIKILQSMRYQMAPTGQFESYQRIPHFFGERNANGLGFNIRNAFLEPSLNPNKDWVDSCLAQIAVAFRWKKPAVICSHRINYIGFIEESNRDRGLKDLHTLMKQVLKKWPDVQFISTDQLVDLLP